MVAGETLQKHLRFATAYWHAFVQRDRNTGNQADTGWYVSNDPGHPAPPEGISFVGPIPNVGGVALSFNGGDDQLLSRMGATGEDLIALDLDTTEARYTVSTSPIASGFDHPVDAAMVENVIYVIEHGNWFGPGGRRSVQAVTLPRRAGTSGERPPSSVLTLAVAPNPAVGDLTLTLDLPTAGSVRLELIDALGRTVRAMQAERAAGRHVETLPAAGLPAGLYLARLVAGGRQTVCPVTLLR